MLAQSRRRSPDPRRALAILDGRVDHLDRAAARVLDLDHHIPGDGVFVVESPLHIVDGRVGHAAAGQDIKPLLRGAGARHGLDLLLELGAVLHAQRVGRVALVGLEVRPADAVAQDREQTVVAAAEEDGAVAGLEGSVWDDGGCFVICLVLKQVGMQRHIQDKGSSRCAVPHRPVSFSPLIKQLLAIFASVAVWQSLNATSRCWPLPDFCLASSAAMMLLLV